MFRIGICLVRVISFFLVRRWRCDLQPADQIEAVQNASGAGRAGKAPSAAAPAVIAEARRAGLGVRELLLGDPVRVISGGEDRTRSRIAQRSQRSHIGRLRWLRRTPSRPTV